MTFRVYQPNLTEAQIEELNGPNGGWGAKPEFTAYADVTTGTFRDGDDPSSAVDRIVRIAASLKLYKYVADVHVASLEQVWVIGNNRPHSKIEEVGSVPMKSISIGDILFDAVNNKGWYCNRSGWVPMASDVMAGIMHLAEKEVA